jgi:transcription elongation factor GreA
MSDEKVYYLSAEGLEALKKEFKELKDVKIPEIASHIDEAKQQGDLSENAEYHEAKETMAWAQGRVMELQYILDHAQLVEKNNVEEKNKVRVGDAVTVKYSDRSKTYTIVAPQEADPANGRISNESPLGQAFLGHPVGAQLEVKTPAGIQTFEIIDIK